MPQELNISEFRSQVGQVFSEVQRHRPARIARGSREKGVLLSVEDVLALVSAHEFHPQVLQESKAVSIWLPEFALYGRGSSFAEAREDLLGEIRAYIDEYLESPELYLHAPNRAHHFPYVMKAWLANSESSLEEVVFAEPTDAG